MVTDAQLKEFILSPLPFFGVTSRGDVLKAYLQAQRGR